MVARAAPVALSVALFAVAACGPPAAPRSHKEAMPTITSPRDPCVRNEIDQCRGHPVRDHLRCVPKERGQDGDAWKTSFFAFLQDARDRLGHARRCGERYQGCLDYCDRELVKIRDEVTRLKIQADTTAQQMDNYCYHVLRVLLGAGSCGEVPNEQACLRREPARPGTR
jgi:hypothetical protein